MTRKRGWCDTHILRFAPASTIQEYSCGLTTSKSRGRRAIAIGAITREGVVPGCTRVVIRGRSAMDGDFLGDMNHAVFKEWIRSSIPHMLAFAGGRPVSIIVDNASYHSRQLEKFSPKLNSFRKVLMTTTFKIPSRSSTKAMIEDYLRSKGILVADNSAKEDLLVKVLAILKRSTVE
ncbi:unnamed protein product [Cylicostephanus goldi]|uniref:Tc1-like transposase DDE domain-containing protein n=1 Tax=Cylicostephanus goldi TaxID=71465 RepID=A0A3P6T534_CYLGO|nr:unnamed protein product [Cylicostephanus goldi]